MAARAASSISIRRCQEDEAALTLSRPGLAWPEMAYDTRKEILRTKFAAIKGQRSLIVLAAEQQGEFCGCVAAQVLPGKVANVTPPQFRATGAPEEPAKSLLIHLDDELRAEGVVLAQTLLAPDDAHAAAAMRAGGYEHAADLVYMTAEAEAAPDAALTLPYELVPVAGMEDSRLAKVVEATYSGTLDCPRIDGLRAAEDVLAGYRAVGDSGDRLWWMVRAADADVGCLLLADHRDTRQWEIVYVGLVPAVRGRGWGLELTRHAQWLARQAGCERVVLAVDAANEPAIRIYSSAGFRAWDRRGVWIKPL